MVAAWRRVMQTTAYFTSRSAHMAGSRHGVAAAMGPARRQETLSRLQGILRPLSSSCRDICPPAALRRRLLTRRQLASARLHAGLFPHPGRHAALAAEGVLCVRSRRKGTPSSGRNRAGSRPSTGERTTGTDPTSPAAAGLRRPPNSGNFQTTTRRRREHSGVAAECAGLSKPSSKSCRICPRTPWPAPSAGETPASATEGRRPWTARISEEHPSRLLTKRGRRSRPAIM